MTTNQQPKSLPLAAQVRVTYAWETTFSWCPEPHTTTMTDTMPQGMLAAWLYGFMNDPRCQNARIVSVEAV